MDLFDLVNSFIEKGYGAAVVDEEEEIVDDLHDDSDSDDCQQHLDTLKRLFAISNSDETRRKATVQIQKAWNQHSPTNDFKLQLVSQLRAQGLDAGLCKSKWEKNSNGKKNMKIPLVSAGGCYEYIDANIDGTRYIIDVSLAAEFQIARPTQAYASLLHLFPQITVFKVRELKQIVRIMCDAITNSMKQRRMHVPPWRRHAYVQAKWFGSYKRITDTTHESTFLQAKSSVPDSNNNGSVVEMLSFPGRSCYRSRRNGFGGTEFGHLAMAINGGAN